MEWKWDFHSMTTGKSEVRVTVDHREWDKGWWIRTGTLQDTFLKTPLLW